MIPLIGYPWKFFSKSQQTELFTNYDLLVVLINWADDKQSKARNLDSKYRQMALVGFDT